MRSTRTRRARRSTSTGCWRTASPPRQPPKAPAVTAVIAAAGSGERLGAGGPKALVPLAGRPMVAWPVDALRACEAVGAIVIAAPPGHEEVLGGEGLTVVSGGATRSRSVENALREVATDLVAIHDAARPLLTPQLIEGLVAALEADSDAAGVIAAAPITDTVKRVAGTSPELSTATVQKSGLAIEETLDRTELWGAQTPQLFWTKALRGALAVDDASRDAATDEAMLVEHAGGKVLIHPSGPENLKVTTPHDLRVAEVVMAERLGGSGRA